jgi:hypothetical protein
MEENHEVLENVPVGAWEGGLNDDGEGGFDDDFREDMNEDGMEVRSSGNN